MYYPLAAHSEDTTRVRHVMGVDVPPNGACSGAVARLQAQLAITPATQHWPLVLPVLTTTQPFATMLGLAEPGSGAPSPPLCEASAKLLLHMVHSCATRGCNDEAVATLVSLASDRDYDNDAAAAEVRRLARLRYMSFSDAAQVFAAPVVSPVVCHRCRHVLAREAVAQCPKPACQAHWCRQCLLSQWGITRKATEPPCPVCEVRTAFGGVIAAWC